MIHSASHGLHLASALTLAASLSALGSPVHAEETQPSALEGIDIAEKLGSKVSPDLSFTDHNGQPIRLGDMLDGQRPVLLSLNYFECPMLCNLQLNALVTGLRQLGWIPGEKFRMITLSIDPKEGPALASEKRRHYLESLDMPGADWNFWVGSKEAIESIAESVGYRFQYVEETGQFAHIPVLFFLMPDGTISRYLYGLEYPARDLKFALVDSAEGRIGTTVDRILLSCFHYDDHTGQYSPFAFGIMRLGGAITLLGLAIFMGWLFKRERHRSVGPEVAI